MRRGIERTREGKGGKYERTGGGGSSQSQESPFEKFESRNILNWIKVLCAQSWVGGSSSLNMNEPLLSADQDPRDRLYFVLQNHRFR